MVMKVPPSFTTRQPGTTTARAMLIANDTIVPWSPYRQETFPRSKGRVILCDALSTYALVQHGISPIEIADAFAHPGDDRTRSIIASDIRFLGSLFMDGRIKTFARPLAGGEPVPMAESLWELDDYTHRFATCALDLRRPFDVEAKPTHRIFVSEDGLQDLIDFCCVDAMPTGWSRSPSAKVAKETSKPVVDVIPAPTDRLLRLPDVERLVGFKRSAIYSRIEAGSFPQPLKSGKISVWRESEVLAWLSDLA